MSTKGHRARVLTSILSVRRVSAVPEAEVEFGVPRTLMDVGHGTTAESSRVIVVHEVVGVIEWTPHRHSGL